MLVVDVVVGHPVVQHPGLVSQTLNPDQDHQDHDEDWEEYFVFDENMGTVVVILSELCD